VEMMEWDAFSLESKTRVAGWFVRWHVFLCICSWGIPVVYTGYTQMCRYFTGKMRISHEMEWDSLLVGSQNCSTPFASA
jgi:hypothetical protein